MEQRQLIFAFYSEISNNDQPSHIAQNKKYLGNRRYQENLMFFSALAYSFGLQVTNTLMAILFSQV